MLPSSSSNEIGGGHGNRPTDTVLNTLVQVQKDVKYLRNTLANAPLSVDPSVRKQIETLLSRTEEDLRERANGILEDKLKGDTLKRPVQKPKQKLGRSDSLQAPPMSHSATATVTMAREPRISHREATQLKQLMNPERSRNLLEENQLVRTSRATTRSLKPLPGKRVVLDPGRNTYVPPKGVRLNPDRFVRSRPDALLAANPGLWTRGLLDLSNRGIIPPHADLTLALATQPMPLSNNAERAVSYPLGTTSDYGPAMQLRMDVNDDVYLESKLGSTKQKKASTVDNGRQLSLPTVIGVQSPEDGGSAKENKVDANARDYDSLLDQFSLHLFLIRKGVVLDELPEFISFKRTYRDKWSKIVGTLRRLEQLCRDYNIPLAQVDGKLLVALAEDELKVPSERQLFGCLGNAQEVLAFLRQPGRRFRGTAGEHAAATKIAANYKGYLVRRRLQPVFVCIRTAIKIQRAFRKHLALLRTRRMIVSNAERERDAWEAMQNKFLAQWPQLTERKRLEIIVPSISCDAWQRRLPTSSASLTFAPSTSIQPANENDLAAAVAVSSTRPSFRRIQNMFLSRILDLVSDPLLDILYVSPFPLEAEGVDYYKKFATALGVCDVDQRLKIVHPENWNRFPETFPLSAITLYSQRLVKRIRNLTRSRVAYLVPFVCGEYDMILARKLGVPLFGTQAQTVSLYGCRSGAKRIFALAETNMPIGAFDLYDSEEIVESLCRLLVEQPAIEYWLLRLDHDPWAQLTGDPVQMYVDARKLGSVQAMLQGQLPTIDENARERAQNVVRTELHQRLPSICHWSCKDIFPTLGSFLKAFEEVGGVIEAYASTAVAHVTVPMFIDPTGHTTVHQAHQHLYSGNSAVASASLEPWSMAWVGSIAPQSVIPYATIQSVCNAVARALFAKHVIGDVSLELTAFPDQENGLRVWATDLWLFKTETALSDELARLCCRLEIDPLTGDALVSSAKQRPVPSPNELYGSSASYRDHEDDRMSARSSRSTASVASAYSVAPSTVSTMTERSFAAAQDTVAAKRRFIVWCRTFEHPSLSMIQHGTFFSSFRSKNIAFDLENSVGCLFVLLDSLMKGFLGFVTVARTAPEAVMLASQVMNTSVSSILGPDSRSMFQEHDKKLLLLKRAFKALCEQQTAFH